MVVLWRSEWWFYGGVSGGFMEEEWVVVLWRRSGGLWRSEWWFYGGVSGGFMEE